MVLDILFSERWFLVTFASLGGPQNPMGPKNPRDSCVDPKMLKQEIMEKIDTPTRLCAQRSINIVICQTLFKTFTFETFRFFYFKVKWSNGVKIRKMGIFWCISITNNVNSCKKINEKAEMANFSVLAKGRRPRQELFAKKHGKLGKLKCKLLNFLKRYDLCRVVPW